MAIFLWMAAIPNPNLHRAPKPYLNPKPYTLYPDMAIFPWMKAIPNFYTGPPRGDDFLQFYSYKNLQNWIQRMCVSVCVCVCVFVCVCACVFSLSRARSV